MKNIIFALMFSVLFLPVLADEKNKLSAAAADPLVEAQEKLIQAKGNYKTIKQQESAIEDMRKATKLSLRAAKLRAKAEKLQSVSDALVGKANQTALSRGLYITGPGAQPKNESQPELPQAQVQSAKAPSFVPVPGQPINIIVPKQEEVSYDQNTGDMLPDPSQ